MATARCYTKSGSVEKYESECFSGDINHYPNNFSSNMTGPDSNGNYSITYDGYYDGDSSNYDCYCETIYGDWRNGGGVKKTFYFKKNGIQITVYYKVIGYNHNGHVAFDCIISGGNEYDTSPNKEIINDILKNSSIYLLWKAVTNNGPFGNYTTRITSVGPLILETGANYVDGTKYYMSSMNDEYKSCDPYSGTYNGHTWDTRVVGGTS